MSFICTADCYNDHRTADFVVGLIPNVNITLVCGFALLAGLVYHWTKADRRLVVIFFDHIMFDASTARRGGDGASQGAERQWECDEGRGC
jgi:hypothetical protein